MKTVAVAILATAIAAPAFAGGPSVAVTEPVVAAPAPVVPVSGNWEGAYVGGQLGYGDVSAPGANGDGAIVGVQTGYRWDLGQTVLGVELDYNKGNIDLQTPGDELDSITRLKAVAGYDMGKTLVYATAGAAYAEGTVAGANLSDNGWFAGVGVDYAIDDQWSVGGELLSNQFDNFGGSGKDLDATTASVRMNYRF